MYIYFIYLFSIEHLVDSLVEEVFKLADLYD